MRAPPRRGCGYPHRSGAPVSYKHGVKRALIAIAAGLALADAAVVILALPPLLLELDTTVEGVAAVIGVYTAVLALALPLSAALHSRATGAAGALLFAAASIGCASANSLELLLVMRALQALGASALLAAAFDALDGGGAGRRLWVGAAVVGTAAGPALGGAADRAVRLARDLRRPGADRAGRGPGAAGEPDRHGARARCRARRATCSPPPRWRCCRAR